MDTPRFTPEPKEEAVHQITERGCSFVCMIIFLVLVIKTARSF